MIQHNKGLASGVGQLFMGGGGDAGEDGFQVGLSFNQIPAKLEIPFAAITAFVDPAVDFGLQFHAAVADIEPAVHETAENDTPEAERGDKPGVGRTEPGSNVVPVDFKRKK